MLLDDINYTSEQGFVQDPDYPEVWHIEAHDLARLKECPLPDCKGKLTSREEAEQPHHIHDYDVMTKRVILISLYRKNYRCTKCKRSCTASCKYNSLSRTDDFDRYIALEAIKGSPRGRRKNAKGKQVWSNEVLGQRYGYGKDTISKIVRARAPAMTPMFIPFPEYELFYIHSFEYKFKKRYCLLACTIAGETTLLGVFGYRDAVAEIQAYFELHEDFIFKDEVPFITAPYDMELIAALQHTMGANAVVIDSQSMTDRLQCVRNGFAEMDPRDELTPLTLIEMLIGYLKDKANDVELLHRWWGLCLEEDAASNYTCIARSIYPLWKEISSNFDVFFTTFQNAELELPDMESTVSDIKKHIKDYSQNGPDFTVLAARIMFYSRKDLLHLMSNAFIYTSDIFTSGQKLKDCIKDKTNEKGQLEGKVFAELLYGIFNPGDINEILLDEFWKHYDDEPEIDKSEYEEMSSFIEENPELYTAYSDIPYDSPYFEEVYKEYLYDEEET